MLRSSFQYFYTVRSGDTVYGISRRFGVPISSVLAANNLAAPNQIYIGQQLAIPLGVNRYVVKKGDTLFNISNFYNVPISAIIETNDLTAPYVIYPDMVLLIPPGVPYYIVQPGDTLFNIAIRFNVVTAGVPNYELLRQENQLTSNHIVPGMRLKIPFAIIGDEGMLAYVSNKGGAYDIWLYEFKTGIHRRITNGLATSFTIPFWSHDNRNIAFVGRNQILHVLNLENGQISTIDQLEVDGQHFIDWSSDNRHLAYTKQNTLILYNVESHTFKNLPINGVSDPGWFPSGNEVLVQATDETGLNQLYRVNVNTLGLEKVTNNEDNPKHNTRLSQDGRFALYTTPGASISIIKTVNVETGEVFEIRGGPLAKNYYPEWSPNSTSLGYSATDFLVGYFSYIRVSGNKGENDHTVSTSTCFATPVTWSPDSQKLVYLSGCSKNQFAEFAKDVWYIDLRHPVPIYLFGGTFITSISWSNRKEGAGTSTFRSEVYRVKFLYPSHWIKSSEERYEGRDGFFQVSAIAGGENIEEICHNEAHHELQPYGSQPRITRTKIEGQEACFIFPSADQPPEMNEQAALIVRYPKPVQIENEVYQYLIVWADRGHLRQIASSLSFL